MEKIYFKELFDVSSGLSKGAKELANGDNPFLTFKTIFNNTFLPDEIVEKANTNECEQEKYSVRKGDVFLTRTSETMNELGMSSVALKDYPGTVFNGFSKRLRMKSTISYSVDLKYLGYYLRSRLFRDQVDAMSNTSTRASLNIEMINRLYLLLPDLCTQKKVGNMLYLLEEKIKNNNATNQNLLQQANAILTSYFIDFSRFNGSIPNDWESGTLQDIADFSNGYAFKSKELLDAPEPGCYRVFKQGHINRGGGFNSGGTKSWYPINKCSSLTKYVLHKGDVLMAMTDMKDNVAILGNTALMTVDNQYIVNQRVGLLRSNGYKNTSYAYIYLLTNSFDFLRDLRSRANSGVQVNLSSTEIKNSPVWIASENINEEFNSLTEPLLTMIMNNDNENQRLAEIRDTLLPKLMSGELDVSDIEL